MMSARGAVAGTRGVRTALVVLRGGEVTWIATVKVVEEGVEERVEEVEKEVEEEAEVMGVAVSASRSALAALAATCRARLPRHVPDRLGRGAAELHLGVQGDGGGRGEGLGAVAGPEPRSSILSWCTMSQMTLVNESAKES